MKRLLLTGALLVIGAANAAAADTFVFKDIRRLHGHDRSMAVKTADARKCGWTKDGRILTSEHAMERCMRGFGWVVSQYIPDPTRDDSDSVQFTDLSPSGKRGDDVLQADAQLCNPTGRLSGTSPQYKRCMLSYGWRFYAYVPPAAQPSDDGDDATAAAQAAEEASDDEQRRNDEERRNEQQTQDMLNAQQDMINTQNMINAQNAANNQ